MAGTIKSRTRKNISSPDSIEPVAMEKSLEIDSPSSDVELYAQEVINKLLMDNLPPTPSNYNLYFDRLLEDKNSSFKKQVMSILELEDSNDDENTIELEKSLKQGFSHVKTILSSVATLYKNMSLMTKILEKRKTELSSKKDIFDAKKILVSLEDDVAKLGSILKTQTTQMKTIYDETAGIIKNVENETIFDNQFGIYNKRYLLSKIEKEITQVGEFEHQSSLIFLELSKVLKKQVKNDKAVMLMTKTLARLLLKTSRRSDIVAHYGNGMFAMLLKHTDIPSAKKASERLCDLVANSNFFLSDREIKLEISIGVTNIDAIHSVEETVVSAMDGIIKAYEDTGIDYAVSLRV
jgi:diguanylate cyclase (GGDEF)-like protein